VFSVLKENYGREHSSTVHKRRKWGFLQTTIKSSVYFSGVGLHSGKRVRMSVNPAAAGTGIRFRRSDPTGFGRVIPAHWTRLEPATLCTRIGDGRGVVVDTIEHLMAALVGCGIHNVLIELDGPEVPILDGSAAPFVAKFLACGLQPLDAPLHGIRIREPVEVRGDGAIARLEPAESLQIEFGIDFDDAAIGRQSKRLDMANGAFVHELSDSRTFCRLRDVEAMRDHGLALGGSFENALVVDGARVLSPGGLRHPDEPVRHKMLDALGDLALAGAPLIGRYIGCRAGHALTGQLLRALFSRTSAWESVELDARALRRQPGAGLCEQDLRATA
jgi:UDP-3-O-[3-hydroxymyristoyl] N-acetylglucosamine deacetylase